MRTAVPPPLRRAAAALAVALACLSASAAPAADEEKGTVVQDPHYGDVLFHFYKGRYFTSVTTLMASHDFQTALQNYLDLEDVRRKLETWQNSFAAFEDVIEKRRKNYEPLLPEVDAKFRELDSQIRLRQEQRRRSYRQPAVDQQRGRRPQRCDQHPHLQVPDRRRTDADHPHADRPTALLVRHRHLNQRLLEHIERRRTEAGDDQHRRRHHQVACGREYQDRQAI